MSTPIRTTPSTELLPIGDHLRQVLKPLGLGYNVRSGLLTITSEAAIDEPVEADIYRRYRDVLK